MNHSKLRIKVKDEYITIRIPRDLTQKIDKIIDAKQYGYRSRAEFVKEAIREKLFGLI